MVYDFSRRPKGFNTPTGKVDFDTTSRALASQALEVCRHLLPSGRRDGHEWRTGDLSGSKGQSLGVHIEGATAGVWKDFSDGQSGNDLIALWAAVKGIKQGEAKAEADEWLGIAEPAARHSLPRAAVAAPAEKPPEAAAEQGQLDWMHTKPDGRWEYHTADGDVFGIMYRWDHPGVGKGKTIRPWNGREYKFPEGDRPPLYLPEILARPSDPIILVEGERKCDRLRKLGYLATTGMGGAESGRKTDWSGFSGRKVLVWHDNDQAGLKYAKIAVEAMREAGAAEARICPIPDGKPAKWDAGDATEQEAHDIIAAGKAARPRFVGVTPYEIRNWTPGKAFSGEPPARRWLVNEVFPLGVGCVLAAPGDTGKGMLLLDLALKVAQPPTEGIDVNPHKALGCRIGSFGSSVILSAEDDHGELHRRLQSIDPNNRLRSQAQDTFHAVALAGHGGAPTLFATHNGRAAVTPEWGRLESQLMDIRDLRLIVIDPLASFVQADINADPAAGAFVCGRFNDLASRIGATVLVAAHMSKGSRNQSPAGPEDARHAVRGTTALVDNMRAVYALWQAPEAHARRLCKSLGMDYRRGDWVQGAVVKANGPKDTTVRDFLRNPNNGLLVDQTERLTGVKPKERDLLALLEAEIAAAARNGKPFASTGAKGLYMRRSEMMLELQLVSKWKFAKFVDELLAKRRIAFADPIGRAGALDVPTGPFATGEETRVERRARTDLAAPEPLE